MEGFQQLLLAIRLALLVSSRAQVSEGLGNNGITSRGNGPGYNSNINVKIGNSDKMYSTLRELQPPPLRRASLVDGNDVKLDSPKPSSSSVPFEGYIYKPPKNQLRYPEEFQKRHQEEEKLRNGQSHGVGRYGTSRDDEREANEQRLQREYKLQEEKRRLELRVKELEQREERLLREREVLENERAKEKEREALVDSLINEYRNMTLEDLKAFTENLIKNQMKEDAARKNKSLLGRGSGAFTLSKQREEISHKSGQSSSLINGNGAERIKDLLNANNGGFSSVGNARRNLKALYSLPNERTSRSFLTARGSSPRNTAGFSSSLSSSSTSTRDQRSVNFYDLDTDSSALIYQRISFSNNLPPIANDPNHLTVASIDDVMERTGATTVISTTISDRWCPVGKTFSALLKKCIFDF